jgi:hypothetical protein
MGEAQLLDSLCIGPDGTGVGADLSLRKHDTYLHERQSVDSAPLLQQQVADRADSSRHDRPRLVAPERIRRVRQLTQPGSYKINYEPLFEPLQLIDETPGRSSTPMCEVTQ